MPSGPTLTPAEMSLKTLRMTQLIFLISVCMYAFIGERMTHRTAHALANLLVAFAAAGVAAIVLAFLVRGKMIQPAREQLRRQADDVRALLRWRAGTLLSLVLCESVALMGFAARNLGCSLSQASPFYIAAIALMVIWTPGLDTPPQQGAE